MNTMSSFEKVYLMSIEDRIICNIYTHYKLGNLQNLTKRRLVTETCAPSRSVNRSLAICAQKGLLKYENKEFIVLDVETLTEKAEILLSITLPI